MREAIIVDVDGTLAERSAQRGPFEWEKVSLDLPNYDIFELVSFYKDAGYAIIVVSGRDECCRQATEDWLANYGLSFNKLFMRPEGDNRKDVLVKQEIYQQEIEGVYSVRVVIDDRQQVVDMWRSHGLRVLQVAPGDF